MQVATACRAGILLAASRSLVRCQDPLAAEAAERPVGRCVCDRTAAQCDPHCCCDPDCNEDGFADLRENFDCLPDGLPNSTGRRCYSQSWLHRVNPRVDLSIVADDLRGLLCVVVDNNPVRGVFYGNEERVEASRLDELREEQRLSSFDAARGPAPAPDPQGRGYRTGDLLLAHRALSRSSGTVQPISGPGSLRRSSVVEALAPLALRVPDLLGACATDPGQPIRFMADVPRTSCWLGPVDLAEACAGSLNPLLQSSWMLRKAQLSGQSRCGSDRCILPNATLSCPLRITSVDGSTRETACSAGSSPFEEPVLERSSTGCVCRSALREVDYTFHYEALSAGSGPQVEITSVELRATLQDVASEACQPVRVYQASSARFVQGGGKAAHARSGNPGYRLGAPLLVATCKADDTDAQATRCAAPHAALVEGILLDGSCARTGQTGSQPGRPMEVHFGEDAIFGCTLDLTRKQLQELCAPDVAAGRTGFVDLLHILPFGRPGARWTHIAAFGDVPLGSQDAEKLVEVELVAKTESLEFSDQDVAASNMASSSSCTGAVVGVDLEVIYSPFGEVGHPQDRIVAARASHRTGVLAHTRLDPAEEQPFPFTFTVTFIRLDNTGKEELEVPPRPRLPLALPHDLFYPFSLGSAGTARALPSLAALLLTGAGICAAIA